MTNPTTNNLQHHAASRFEQQFHALTDRRPLSWQTRLFCEHFAKGELPPVIDIPTGLGKTMVMAIWLIARSINDNLPRRLIYVVDRRTVVDQATDLATMLRERFGKNRLAISTLRGQLADNREWSKDPSKPAIVIGTVDLIGSGLLFSGYRSSYKRRPLEAGLLGQDSLLVLDEAHLSKPFEKLIRKIEDFQKDHGSPMRIIRMSATSGHFESQHFHLLESDFSDSIVNQRINAKKRFTITPDVDLKKLHDAMADATIELATNAMLQGKRIVVFVRKPDDAKTIANSIREHVIESVDASGVKPKKIKSTPYSNSVEILTGTMRGLERDKLVEKPVFRERWLNGDLKADDPTNQCPVFLVATSAGEVGFDLNADHMVCDATTIDSFIQRLGRVNRRGEGDAQIHLVIELPKKEKDGKPKKLEGLESAIANTIALLRSIPDGDVSPKNIGALRKSEAWKEIYRDACSPAPATVELTDILLDNWSMTSIRDPMPGRPEVGPWLRGIADELPQTTVAWRAELDEAGFANLDQDDIEEWFDTHRILTHETLSVPTSGAAKWLKARWDELPGALQSLVADRPVILDRAGMAVVTVKKLIDQLSRQGGDSTALIRFANLILPASFGGIERGVGLLDQAAPKKPENAAGHDEQANAANALQRLAAPDVADVAPGRIRLREVLTVTEDGGPEARPIGGGAMPPNPLRTCLDLESDDERVSRLVSFVPRRERLEFGSGQPETLVSHVTKVRNEIDSILDRLRLPEELKQAARLAAEFHDHGKNRERWQRCAGRKEGQEPLGKPGGPMKREPRGYRHEFGSLRELADEFGGGKVPDAVFDLAMHLIAVHHGRGRPHFPKGGFDPDCEARADSIHADSIRRFARLQRKYGWWHLAWLENLLRCADALASAEQDAEDHPTNSEGDKA